MYLRNDLTNYEIQHLKQIDFPCTDDTLLLATLGGQMVQDMRNNGFIEHSHIGWTLTSRAKCIIAQNAILKNPKLLFSLD